MRRLLFIAPLLVACQSADRCSVLEAHVEAVQSGALLELPPEPRASVLRTQRAAIVELALRDCGTADGPYTTCLLAATDLPSVSACSGGGR